MTREINLGFVISSDGSQWTGGLEYYINLLKSVRMADTSQRIKIIGLITPGLDPVQIQRIQVFFDETIFMSKSTLLQKAYEYVKDMKFSRLLIPFIKSPVEKAKSKIKINVAFAPPDMIEYLKIPNITWIPDFQHVYYPEFFSTNEIANRNHIFRVAGGSANVVVLSSDTALSDFKKLFPDATSKAEVLRFVAHTPADAYHLDVLSTIKKYNLPEKFYYLPNQFWIHKNHRIVLQALEICVTVLPEICIVCTGNLYEYRDLAFPSLLMSEVSRRGLRNNFIVLGLIDRFDVYALVRQSLAVLQPSLFEGWSTTVEEAKSLGKTVILSDIPVHREQDPHPGLYFDPRDAHQLAHIMLEQWNSLIPGVDSIVEDFSKLNAEEKMMDYGSKFIQCLDMSLQQL